MTGRAPCSRCSNAWANSYDGRTQLACLIRWWHTNIQKVRIHDRQQAQSIVSLVLMSIMYVHVHIICSFKYLKQMWTRILQSADIGAYLAREICTFDRDRPEVVNHGR